MTEVMLNTYLNGSEISLIMVEQAFSLFSQNQKAVQLKNHNQLEFYIGHKELLDIQNYKIIENAPHIYDLNSQINPATFNILFISSIYILNMNNAVFYEKISRFDEIWVADQTIKNFLDSIGINKKIFVVSPNLFIYPKIELPIAQSPLNILCNFPTYGEDSFFSFFKAYIQEPKFENAELILISDILVNSCNFITNKITNIKKEYNIESGKYKVKMLPCQAPLNVNHCIINSDLFILPYANNNGWNLYAAHGAQLGKPVILTPYSCMTNYINNCEIVMDLPKMTMKNKTKVINEATDIWKLFFKEKEINKETSLINKNISFLDLCNQRL